MKRMDMPVKMASVAVIVTCFTACAGVRQTNDWFSVHAESVRVLGFSIPCDDRDAAWDKLKEEVGDVDRDSITVLSSASDWTSVTGVLGKVLWIRRTTITGRK